VTNRPVIAIIGGTGLTELSDLEILESEWPETRFGEPSASLIYGRLKSQEIVFLPRHGEQHRIPPHKINYRANIFALKARGVRSIVAVNAVGGITSQMAPQTICIPDQIIDYSYGRDQSFSDGTSDSVQHIDFTEPYHPNVRDALKRAAIASGIDIQYGGVYACTQGPRLESRAEVDRLERDGCDVVGMTGMPEAGLARELGLEYASINLVVNWAAGRSDEMLTMSSIAAQLDKGMVKVRQLLQKTIQLL